jgi:hypothetical protein
LVPQYFLFFTKGENSKVLRKFILLNIVLPHSFEIILLFYTWNKISKSDIQSKLLKKFYLVISFVILVNLSVVIYAFLVGENANSIFFIHFYNSLISLLTSMLYYIFVRRVVIEIK